MGTIITSLDTVVTESINSSYSDSVIKVKYEANSNTNTYTDAYKAKLDSIESGATADQTKADIEGLGIDAASLTGVVGSAQLPSYVDDVVIATSLVALDSITFESGKVYVTQDTNITYRWDGVGQVAATNLIIIGTDLALGETSSTAYRGDHGKIAYNHSQAVHDKTMVGLANVDNTSDVSKPVSTAMQLALNGKVDDFQVLTDVPSGAVFTDTVYNDTSIAAAVALNTAKATNVSTQLSLGTNNGTTLGITSDGGVDAVILPQVTASGNSGVMSGTDKQILNNLNNGVW